VIGFEFVASIAPILAFRRLSGWRDSAGVSEARVRECSNPVSGLEISPGVRIWYVPHGPWDRRADRCATFVAEDVAEFSAIRDIAVRRRSLTTRAALRIALSQTVDGRVAPQAWRFGRTETGKPMLIGGPKALHFSCSHTEWASVIAVSASRDVGIDIEASVFPSTGQWLSDTFTASERAAVNTLPKGERDQAVSRLWTLKEAYLKMLGTGIADALLVAFDPRNDRLVSGQQDRRAATSFQTWIVNCQGQPLSVAIAMSDATTKGAFWRQSIEECRVRLRARFAPTRNRANPGTALVASLFRGAGAAAAGPSSG
jgi:4'-phosphopantetheinyl transferase